MNSAFMGRGYLIVDGDESIVEFFLGSREDANAHIKMLEEISASSEYSILGNSIAVYRNLTITHGRK